ncbi:hypothetical protein LguiB_005925 [Lonicera macranthoides]
MNVEQFLQNRSCKKPLNLMAEDGSSGKRSANDERRLEGVKQRLDIVDESLCKIAQMIAALTAEVKIGRQGKQQEMAKE